MSKQKKDQKLIGLFYVIIMERKRDRDGVVEKYGRMTERQGR
jgi:hypothetical protein